MGTRLVSEVRCLRGEVRALLIRFDDLHQDLQAAHLLDHLDRVMVDSEELLREHDATVLAQHGMTKPPPRPVCK